MFRFLRAIWPVAGGTAGLSGMAREDDLHQRGAAVGVIS
jgi:hypothetical protein